MLLTLIGLTELPTVTSLLDTRKTARPQQRDSKTAMKIWYPFSLSSTDNAHLFMHGILSLPALLSSPKYSYSLSLSLPPLPFPLRTCFKASRPFTGPVSTCLSVCLPVLSPAKKLYSTTTKNAPGTLFFFSLQERNASNKLTPTTITTTTTNHDRNDQIQRRSIDQSIYRSVRGGKAGHANNSPLPPKKQHG